MSHITDCESIIKLKPAFKDYLWGGTKLRDIYNKECDLDIVAESWELSAHPDGPSVLASGKYAGMSFIDFVKQSGEEILGTGYNFDSDFPLLIKFIDAKQNLSVQVHPDDEYAMRVENGYGKTEMWYVIDAEPGAGLYVGFNEDVSRDEVERRIADNTIMDVLAFHPTKPGDVFFIPAGTVHAIGAGNLIAEIQQNSNSTYRLYDYDRRDKFGNPRELHLKKALDVLDYKEYKNIELNGRVSCKYFDVSFIDINGSEQISLKSDSFYAVTCIKGEGKLILDEEIDAVAGETFFILASNKKLMFNGRLSVIISKL